MRPLLRLSLCAFATAVASPAQGAFVEGRIVDVLGGPVPAAEVLAVVDENVVARTRADMDGIYQLRLPPGGAALQVRAAGKAGVRLPWRGHATPRVQVVELEDAAALRGQVRDADGNPVAGATLVAVAADGDACTATSDANGAYEFAALPLRAVDVRAVHGATSATARTLLRGDARLDLTLDAPAGVVVVRVAGLPAAAAATARVRVFGSDFSAVQNRGRLTLAADGTTVFQPEQDCMVGVEVPGYRVEPANLCIVAGSRLARFTAVPEPTPPAPDQLRGAVRTLAGTNGAVGELRLVARDRSQRDLAATQTDRSGEFRFQFVLPPERFCRIGIPLGNWLLVDDELAIRDGFAWVPVQRPGERLELLVERAGLVRGQIRDLAGIPFCYAAVVVADSDHPWRALVETATDRSGNVSLGLPPGLHDLLAVDHIGRVAVATTEVVAGQTVTVQWRMLDTGAVDGVLRDAAGNPVPGVELHLGHEALIAAGIAHAAMRQRCLVRTDRDGRFRCRGLPPGSWIISARDEGTVEVLAVDVDAGATTRAEVAYRR